MVTDFAILGGLSLIYRGMLTTIITLARTFVQEQRMLDVNGRDELAALYPR